MMRRILLIVAVAALCVAVVVALKDQQWSAVAALSGPADLALVSASFVVNCLGLFVAMVAWRALVQGLDVRIGLWVGARIYFVGILAKLVPGRVWSLLANMRMGSSIGVPPARMAAAYVLTIPVTLLTGLAVGLVGAPTAFGGQAAWLALAAALLVLLAAKPDLVNRLAAALTRLARRPAPQTSASAGGIRRAIAAQWLSWLIAGVHLWLLAIAAGAPVWRSLPLCLGAFGLAAVLSALIVFLPDGLGAREAMLIAALTTLLPLPAATTVVVISRLVCTLSEVAVAALALAVTALSRRLHGKGDSAARLPDAGIEPHGDAGEFAGPNLGLDRQGGRIGTAGEVRRIHKVPAGRQADTEPPIGVACRGGDRLTALRTGEGQPGPQRFVRARRAGLQHGTSAIDHGAPLDPGVAR